MFRLDQRIFFAIRILLIVVFPSLMSTPSAYGAEKKKSPLFRVESPTLQLDGLPIPKLRIVALGENGTIDTTFHQHAEIQGVVLQEAGSSVPLPAFQAGVLELKTDRAAGRFLLMEGHSISVSRPNEEAAMVAVIQRLPGWTSLLPPLIAIVLAIWWQEVISALLVACLVGMSLINFSISSGLLETVDPLLLSTLADSGNMRVIMFTMFLGAMIGVMSGSGGTRALVERLTVYVKNRKQGQLTTWFLGLVIFFDDYGNTLLVGSTMRSVMDRLRISREKLAFLVDSTAAPVAGLALVSTWVGVEIGYLTTAYEGVGLSTENIYQTFLATIPYRLYPILALIFVGQVAMSGRDFGPMLVAEWNRQREGESIGSDIQQPEHTEHASALRHAIIPLVTLCVCLGFFLLDDIEASSRALLFASVAAVLSAVLSVVISRSHSLGQTIGMGIDGMKQMLPAVLVLVLAWSMGTVCNPDHLNTSGYLVDALGDHLSPRWLPLMTFLLSAGVSFATGTSYGTMGLLIPLAVSIEYQLLTGDSVPVEEIGNHAMMLATVGSILGGAIFGDHCSPISDTTVLSSAATGCDHLSHVRTQLPYALTVAGIVICLGYVPVAMGVSPYISIVGAIIVQWIVLKLIGKEVDEANGI